MVYRQRRCRGHFFPKKGQPMNDLPIAFVPLLEPMFQASFAIAASGWHVSNLNTASDMSIRLVDFLSGWGRPLLPYAA